MHKHEEFFIRRAVRRGGSTLPPRPAPGVALLGPAVACVLVALTSSPAQADTATQVPPGDTEPESGVHGSGVSVAVQATPTDVSVEVDGAADPDSDLDREALRYVALGDSFTAGPLVPSPHGSPALCLRSTNNYPALVAEALDVDEVDDVSCASATTEHMFEPQRLTLGQNDPQLDALTEDTDLVTLGIGGNDLGFADVVRTCSTRSALDPHGDPCRSHFEESDGGDELTQRVPEVGTAVAEVLDAITERSPHATVAVVGYLRILPEEEGCWPREPIAAGDVGYLDGIQTALNDELDQVATAAGARFVDVAERGHDICQSPGDKWVEGFGVTSPAAPVHPNAAGMEAVAHRVTAAVEAPLNAGSPRG
ncbi:SGNH/GDSL hydrolase family protein [Lipingzhangella sp. LS1_29]|uniref:SGNH/GDSL hydrolase family protein n=1 Tax=Lipingzhangella rawalii TaxID=2055835 RepID=A0ABU2HA53_9ACTN|nr:SGNH/GDSL hydrolase family protein [Lipingzhangella rawalii]MDS1271725.1 SGNH/GDSL hydrolase family protein [Lipingzhangella rawalii]